MAKEYKYASDSLKYWNRETSYLRGKQAAAIGLSRTKSDIYQKAMSSYGAGNLATQGAEIEYQKALMKDPRSAELGRSRVAGRAKLLDLLQKQGEVENTIDKSFTRNLDAQNKRAILSYQSNMNKARAQIGGKPEWGPPVMMPPKDKGGQFMQNLSMALSIASFATSPIAGLGGANQSKSILTWATGGG